MTRGIYGVPLTQIPMDDILDVTIEDMHRHLHRRLGTPQGILQDEIHTATCKDAERVTRQQRRHLERQRRKAR